MGRGESFIFTKQERSPGLREVAQDHAQGGKYARLAREQEYSQAALYAEHTYSTVSFHGPLPPIRSPWLMENDIARVVSTKPGEVSYTVRSPILLREKRRVNLLSNCNDNEDPSEVANRPGTGTSVITRLYERDAGPWLLQSPALTVLVVEDNYVSQKLIEKIIQKHGWKAILANHGGEAIDVIKRSVWWNNYVPNAIEFDAVAMDTCMPVMSGMECIMNIREMEQMRRLNAHIPIVGMLADSRPDSVEKMFGAGMVSL